VNLYLDSAADRRRTCWTSVHEHVVLATGCHWRRDGYRPQSTAWALRASAGNERVFTPDDLMDGRWPQRTRGDLSTTIISTLGSVLAEALAQAAAAT
jgi:dimethylamine/trimethylamine dehydrogenase